MPTPERETLQRFINAAWIPRIIHLAASLELPDLLSAGPLPISILAERTATSPHALGRLLGALSALGILDQRKESFALTGMGRLLCRNTEDSLYHDAMLTGSLDGVWQGLEHALKTGEPAFDHVFGTDVWTYLAANPQMGEWFEQGMARSSRELLPHLLETYDFSEFRHVIDLGGGYGGLLHALLDRFPHMQGELADLPEVIARAPIHDRCTLTAVDFFRSIPVNGDAYLLKYILHDWNDQDCARILANCRRAMKPHSKILVMERCLPENEGAAPTTRQLDLSMLAFTGGRIRTGRELEELLRKNGFEILTTQAIHGDWLLTEARPAGEINNDKSHAPHRLEAD